MKKSISIVAAVGLAFIVFVRGPASAATYYVPDIHTTIQAALTYATSGIDTENNF